MRSLPETLTLPTWVQVNALQHRQNPHLGLHRFSHARDQGEASDQEERPLGSGVLESVSRLSFQSWCLSEGCPTRAV